jgi:hypothetical protein
MSLRRLIERELIAGIAAWRRRTLIERVRGNPDQRRGWDRAIAAFRVLEQREVSGFELDQVERWLFEDLDAAGVVADRPAREGVGRRWTTLALTLVSVAAVGLLVWIDPGSPTPITLAVIDDADDMQPRGEDGWTRPLALELVCGSPARPAASRGCNLDELLGFSLRLGDESLDPSAASALARAPLYTSVFGIAADGELLYYLPTPIEPSHATLRLGTGWQALPISVRLDVNHEPGRVRVFALASEAPADVADIERWVSALRAQPRAGIDDPPWHRRLAPSVLGPVCRDRDRCASAETELSILITPITPISIEPPRTDP